MRSFIFSQCSRDFRTGVIREEFWRSGDSTSKRVLDVLEFFLSETVEDYNTVSCSSRVMFPVQFEKNCVVFYSSTRRPKPVNGM